MSFLGFIGALVIFYFIFQIISWCILDSDLELFITTLLGKRITHLQGKVVWITGASSGIGRNLAIQLAKHGVKLVLSARRVYNLEEVKQQCLIASTNKLFSQDILILPMDMLKIHKFEDCFNQVLTHFGSLDILVNNAGRSQRANWADIDLEVDKELFNLDVFSVVHLSRIVIRYFVREKKQGHIAVTSSVAGLVGAPNSASYTGAKHSIHGYFESLRTEMNNINVTIFCPGPTVSEFLQECFTNKQGEKYGTSVQPQDRRMTGERCGYLYAVALANRTELTWCGRFPVQLLVSIALYYPNISRLIRPLLRKEVIRKIRDSN